MKMQLHSCIKLMSHLKNDDHPIIQKYYAASAEVGSTIEDQEMMISMARKLCDIVEHNN
jgi:hypothetical protein